MSLKDKIDKYGKEAVLKAILRVMNEMKKEKESLKKDSQKSLPKYPKKPTD